MSFFNSLIQNSAKVIGGVVDATLGALNGWGSFVEGCEAVVKGAVDIVVTAFCFVFNPIEWIELAEGIIGGVGGICSGLFGAPAATVKVASDALFVEQFDASSASDSADTVEVVGDADFSLG